jgi:hypothetical protein
MGYYIILLKTDYKDYIFLIQFLTIYYKKLITKITMA